MGVTVVAYSGFSLNDNTNLPALLVPVNELRIAFSITALSSIGGIPLLKLIIDVGKNPFLMLLK